MPNRMIQGEAIWDSNKLLRVPDEYRSEYTNLLPLALANGSFECNPNKIWSRVYRYNRADKDREFVKRALEAFESAKMLFRWEAEDGVTWGYWVGIEKPGRLPSGTSYKNAAKGQPVPQEALEKFLSNGNRAMTGPQPGNDRQGLVGLGLDWIGKDIRADINRPHESASPRTTLKPPDETLLAVEEVWACYIKTLGRKPKLCTFTKKRRTMGLARWHESFSKAAEPKAENATAMMKLCIDRLAKSAFHNGKNDRGQKFIDWEILFRSQEQMEKWLNDDNFAEAE